MVDSLRSLASAVSNMPAPPCEHFKCNFMDACKSRGLACLAFEHYVTTGQVMPPDSDIVVRRPDKDGHGRIVKKSGLPSRGRFRKIFSEG